MSPLRIGLLGCAAIARRKILPAMAVHPCIQVAAVASRDGRRAQHLAAEYGARATATYDDLLDDPDVDAVYVPLPASLHEPWTAAALRAGKHVLAEKPLALDPMAVRRLYALATSSGLTLMENVMFVHHRQHRVVKDLLEGGRIGELRSLRATFTIPRLPDDDIRYALELGGGSLNDVGVYAARAAIHLVGPSWEVVGATSLRRGGIDMAGSALLRTPGGVSAQLYYGLDHGYQCNYELHGSTGSVFVDRAFTPPATMQPLIALTDGSEATRIPCREDDQIANTLSAFVAAIEDGHANHRDSMAQADLMQMIRTVAGRTGNGAVSA